MDEIYIEDNELSYEEFCDIMDIASMVIYVEENINGDKNG